MSKGSIDRASTELDGYHNRHVHPKVRRLFGINWFQWNEDAAKKVLFKDSIDYEKCIHRQFIIAAYREIHQIPRSGNKSSTSTGHGSPTTTERSSDSQRTISALPRAASAVPAPAYPCYPTFIEQVPYDQESSSAQQTSESRSLQTRSDRPLSSPDVLSTVQSSSSGHPEPMDSRILQSHPRRHVSYPEVCDLIRLHPQESTDGEDLQTGDERSCGESLLSTPRPSRTALNYTNTNFPRPGFPKETDLTVKEGKRRIEQLDNEEYDPFFPLPDEPQMVNSQDRTEFDREWRFPYAQGVTDVPPPSFVPLHRAMPRCEHPQSQQPQSLSLQTQQLHFQQYQAQPYYNQPYQDQQYHDPHLQAQQLQCEQYQAQAYQFQQYQAQQLQAQKEQAKEQVQEQQAHDQQAQKQQTQPPQVPPVALYRIPHHRATSSSYSQAPIYHVPHATAQNIRSHSDPFAPGPYETSGTRSQSDVPSVVPLVNTPYFDNVRQGQRERRDWRETHNDANK